jgi:hypothetical protein
MSSSPQLTPDQLNFADTAMWKTILREALTNLRVAIPAIVQSFDAVAQTVAVQIAIREVVRTTNGPQSTAINPIFNVPIQVPRAGKFAITMPIQQGDEGLLVFADMCFDLWWSRGGVQDQFERRRHDLTDCFFIPGIWSQPNVLNNYSTDSMQLRTVDGTVIVDVQDDQVEVTAPDVTVNASGDINVAAEGNLYLSGNGVHISSGGGNKTVIDGNIYLEHVHGGVQTGGSDTGPVA